MRILFLGDVVGRSGREVVKSELPALRSALKPDAVVVNCENAAHGFGVTEHIAADLLDSGIDVLTGGNHTFDQKEALIFIAREPRLLRPINFPAGTPGNGTALVDTPAGRLLVINAMGRLFMVALDDPFAAVERELGACELGRGADAILIDFHAETTSEKMSMAHYVDGRASLVVGTHTHVPTADHQILPGGTAYLSDAGMCGDYNSVIGHEHRGADPALHAQDQHDAHDAGGRPGNAVRGVRRSRSRWTCVTRCAGACRRTASARHPRALVQESGNTKDTKKTRRTRRSSCPFVLPSRPSC